MRDHRLRQRGDPVPDPLHPGGRARLPGAGAAAPGQLVRPAAVAPAVQAAADGRRPRAVLPAGPLLPRRGLPQADRQPEFTQIDLEMSFVTREDVIRVGEAIVATGCGARSLGYEIPLPLPRMTYADAMARSTARTSPTCASACELTDLTEYFAGTSSSVSSRRPYVGAVVMPGGGVAVAPRARRLAGLGQGARRPRPGLRPDRAAGRLPGHLAGPGRARTSPRSRTGRAGRSSQRGFSPATAVFFAAGAPRVPPQELLGAARLEIGVRGCDLIDTSAWSFTLGGGRPDVRGRPTRAAGPRCTTRSPSPLPESGPTSSSPSPGGRPGRRLRHGLQRLRDRRRLDPHPPVSRCSSRSSTSSA